VLNLKLVGIFEDKDKINRKEVFGFELKDISEINNLKPDAVLITSLIGQEEKMEQLRKFIDLRNVQVSIILAPS
jgi:hypothetical protein